MKASHGGAGLKLLLVLAVFSACLALAWMLLLPLIVARAARSRTGFGVVAQSVYCNPFTARLEVHGLTLSNPADFPQSDFITLRELRIVAQPASLFSGRWEIDDAAVDLAGITVVRDARGRVNARIFQERLGGPPAAPSGPAAKTSREFVIRRLTVRIDRLVLVDYTLPKPEPREYRLNFNRTYENLTSGKQLAAPLADALGSLVGVLSGTMPDTKGMVSRAGETLKEAGRKAGDAVKGLFESLEKTFQK